MRDAATGFKRIHKLPRRWHLLKRFGSDPLRLRHKHQQSRRRFESRDDAFTNEAEVFACGEIGRLDGFQVVITESEGGR